MARNVTRKYGRKETEMRIVTGIIKGLYAAGQVVSQDASDRAPVATGRLARSIHSTFPEEIEPLTFVVYVGTNVEYARAQEMGSGLFSEDATHMRLIEIKPVNAQALAFSWPGGPTGHSAYDPETGLFFFKRVFHPGVPAQPYLRPALQHNRDLVRRMILQAIVNEMRR